MAAVASCIGVRAMLRPSTRAIATSEPEPPSTKLPVIQVPQTNGNNVSAGNTGSLMSRHDLVSLFARDAPLAKAKSVVQADGAKAPAWAPTELVKSAVSDANTVTKKFEGLFHSLVPGSASSGEHQVLKGYVVIQKKILALDLTDLTADKMDDIDECAGRHVTIQIVSTKVDPKTKKPLTSDEVAIKNWNYTIDMVVSAKFGFNMEFDVPKDFGEPGAIIVKNRHKNEFLLSSFSLTMPDNNTINFPTQTWVYSTLLKPGRIIFSNQVSTPVVTPHCAFELEDCRFWCSDMVAWWTLIWLPGGAFLDISSERHTGRFGDATRAGAGESAR